MSIDNNQSTWYGELTRAGWLSLGNQLMTVAPRYDEYKPKDTECKLCIISLLWTSVCGVEFPW